MSLRDHTGAATAGAGRLSTGPNAVALGRGRGGREGRHRSTNSALAHTMHARACPGSMRKASRNRLLARCERACVHGRTAKSLRALRGAPQSACAWRL